MRGRIGRVDASLIFSARALVLADLQARHRATAESDPGIAARLMAGGGLTAEQVPWLVRQGVRAFHVGRQVRPGASSKAYVDAGYVRSWRSLLDGAMDRL